MLLAMQKKISTFEMPNNTFDYLKKLSSFYLSSHSSCLIYHILPTKPLALTPTTVQTVINIHSIFPPSRPSGDFYDSASIATYASAVKKESSKSATLPAEWIAAEMRKIGLESFVHHYNLTYPLGIAEGEVIPGL